MPEGRRRRVMSSQIGRSDLGESVPQKVLSVDDQTYFEAEPEIREKFPQGQSSFVNPEVHEAINKNAINLEEEEERRQRRIEKEKAPTAAIQRFEVLTGIGRLTRDVEIGGTKFSLKSLKNKEMKNVIIAAAQAENKIDEMFMIRSHTLAYAIYKINDQDISMVLSTDDFNVRVDMVEEFDNHIVDMLWNEHSDMLSVHNKAIEKDLGTTSKEVSDNIKKS